LIIPDKEHLAPDYFGINPRGRVPTLITPQGPLAENPAILAYLAQTHPEKRRAPTDPFPFAKTRSVNLYLASTLHVVFSDKAHAARWADDPDANRAMQAKVPANIAEAAQFADEHLLQGPWVLGEAYSFCDPYVFLVHRRMAASGIG
jgi:glutathione S-transferase